MRRHYDVAQCRCDVPSVSSVTPCLCGLGHWARLGVLHSIDQDSLGAAACLLSGHAATNKPQTAGVLF